MTERKPPGMTFETWIDHQIREARKRGEFDNLPGTGKPLEGIDEPYDEMWWVKKKLAREGVSVTPPTLSLRKALDDALEEIARQSSEEAVRDIVMSINQRIRDANRMAVSGPPSNLMPLDVERVVQKWRSRRAEGTTA